MSNADQIRSLGEQFLSTGVLDRQLRPWLWRELRPCIVHDEAQMDFLVDLMEHFGLLVAVPGSDPQQWMLPMRLPERNVVLATATAQGAFAAFLSEIASRSQAGTQALDLPSAAAPIVHAQIISAAGLRNGCERSYRKADAILEILGTGPRPCKSIRSIDFFKPLGLYRFAIRVFTTVSQ